MSVLIKNMEMPKGCIYANDNDQTEYCPLLNHDDVPFCQYIESEPEIAIGIGERPVYCPLSDVPEPCENTVSRQAAIDAVMQYCPDDDGSCSKADRDIRELLDDIENLPSAQPEIVRCKDCIFGHLYFDVYNGVADSWIECRNPNGLNRDVADDGYCYAGAERRTDE